MASTGKSYTIASIFVMTLNDFIQEYHEETHQDPANQPAEAPAEAPQQKCQGRNTPSGTTMETIRGERNFLIWNEW
jgi:hypothetical protein